MLIFTTMKTTTNDIALAKRLYPEYNAKYFDSECPPGLSIKERYLGKDILALVDTNILGKRTARTDSKNVEFVGLFFNNKFQLSEEQLKSLLLHEMIHVWLFSQGIIRTADGSYHGKEFKEKLSQVSSESGIQVFDTENSTEIQISDKFLSKPIYGLFIRYQGKNSIVRLSSKMWTSEMRQLVDWAESLSKRFQAKECWFFEVSNMESMLDVMVSTNPYDNHKFFNLSSEDVSELKEKAEIVRQIR